MGIRIPRGKLHIIVTYFDRKEKNRNDMEELNRLILDMRDQTCPDWLMYIVHDGPAKVDFVKMVKSFRDPRIALTITKHVNGYWGHPNRAMMLDRLETNSDDYVLITNHDNQYLRPMVEYFRSCFSHSIGMVYCHCCHNYIGWDMLKTKVRIGNIDMGQFIVRVDIAKKVGFSTYAETADGTYAEECAQECHKRKLAVKEINKVLFIHN